MKFSQFLEVFQAGKQVAHPEFWKKKTIDANVLIVLISGLIGILNMFDCSVCNIQLTTEQIVGLTTGLTTVIGIFNIGSTAATTTKIGIIKPSKVVVDESLENDIEKLQ